MPPEARPRCDAPRADRDTLLHPISSLRLKVQGRDKIRVNPHRGKIEDAVVKAVIKETDGVKLQVDVVGLDLTS